MDQEAKNTGAELERRVADAYREMGARVTHDIRLAGNQIDVYVELETPDRGLHRIAVEAKDHARPVGVKIVNDFARIVDLLRRERLINEGVIVSSSGFSKEARDAATTHGIRLLELADLRARTTKLTPPTPMAVPPISHLPHEPSPDKRQVATLRLWRVFVASPSDVLVEREMLKEIVQELNENVAHFKGIHADLVDWQNDVVPLIGDPQQVILEQLRLEETDLLILILWHRFEILIDQVFALAHNLWKEKGHPQISVYRCQRKIDLAQADVEQLAKLQAFIEGFQAAGRYPGVVQRYESVEEFGKRIRRDLIALLHTRVGQPEYLRP